MLHKQAAEMSDNKPSSAGGNGSLKENEAPLPEQESRCWKAKTAGLQHPSHENSEASAVFSTRCEDTRDESEYQFTPQPGSEEEQICGKFKVGIHGAYIGVQPNV